MSEAPKMDGEKMLKRQVLLAQEGNAQAFRELFDALSDKFFGYTVSHTNDRDAALDIVQETFIDLWKALPRFHFRGDEQFYGFAFLVLRRKVAHFHRRRKTVSLEDTGEVAVDPAPAEDYRHLKRTVEELPPSYAEVIRLRYWSSLSYAEIASSLSISENTAKVRHHRAVRLLENILNRAQYGF